jgi:AAA15 family ATPase/GTPase
MLDSITIKNFKAIGEKGLTLNNLANVNYLVGTNGCGKSSVLEMLFNRYNETDKILKQFPSSEITILLADYKAILTQLTHKNNIHKSDHRAVQKLGEVSSETYLNTSGQYNQAFSNLVEYSNLNMIDITLTNFQGTIINSQVNVLNSNKEDIKDVFKLFGINIVDFNICNARSEKGETSRNYMVKFEENGEWKNLDFLAGGYIYLIKLCYLLSIKTEFIKNGNLIINIEEPEAQLHPKLQKLIPKVLNYFIKKYEDQSNNIQFFISTHSPFIISASAEFEQSQKVYLIDNGQTVGLDFDPENIKQEMYNTSESQNGYSGYQAKEVSNKLLGAGLEDLHKQIVICEGKPNNKTIGMDAEIYNTIFFNQKYLFISSGGEKEITANSDLAKRVLKNIFKNTKSIAFYLKDGDKKSAKTKISESLDYEIKYGAKIIFLKRYAIETYLLDPEIVNIKYNNIDNYLEKYESWKLKEEFDHGKELRLILDANKEEKQFFVDLAKLIAPDTNVYKELHSIIFC